VSNYTKSTDFAVKDGLLSGNPAKIIKGTEIDTEFNNISTAISTKADLASPTFTGTPAAPTASPGTNTTQVATTAFVGAAVTAATGSLGTLSTQNANNVSITGGSITGITDLAVADGGTGRSTLTSNNVLLGNGTSAINFVAPGTSGNVLTSNGTTWASSAIPAQGLGVGQSWTDVTASRSLNTTYTNSTGKSIFVIVGMEMVNDVYDEMIVTIDTVVSTLGWYTGNGASAPSGSFIVPNGSTYKVECGSRPIETWTELR
jgi:hypothetical protein